MKISEIVFQLANVLPRLSDRYTSGVSILSLVGDGATATVITDGPHGFSVGSSAFISKSSIETEITGVSVVGNKVSITTNTSHDLTLGWPPHATVTLAGFADSLFNGSFPLTEVPNRKNFSVTISGASTPVLTGDEILEEEVFGAFNGATQVDAVINPTTFQFASNFSGTGIDGVAINRIRIAGAATNDRALEEYTKQASGEAWIFVVQQQNVSVNKDRRALGDAISEQSATTDWQQDILDGFSVLCFLPSSDSKAGLDVSDVARHDVLSELLLALRRYSPSTGLADPNPSRLTFTDHGILDYNGAVYAHQYLFQLPSRMTLLDTVEPLETVAFRDVDLTINNPETNGVLTALIDLDNQPLT